jgi:hypothetical protein
MASHMACGINTGSVLAMRPEVVFDQHESVKIGTIVMNFLNGEQEELDSNAVTKINYAA